MKYLGVVIDDRLNFKENLVMVYKKMSKKVNFLVRNRKRLDYDTKLLLYKSLIAPSIDYCSSILFLMNETDFRRLQKVQNRALRSIKNADRLTHIETMLNDTRLLDIKQRIYYNVLILIYKARNKMLPDYMCRFLKCVGESQPYNLRSNQHYRLPSTTSNSGQNSLAYKGVREFNELMRTKVNLDVNIGQYKKLVFEHVKLKYASH